jgi:hypothetical protein
MAANSGSMACAWRSRSMKSNRGAEMASMVPSSVSRRERASATVFVAPDLYSTEKSKPKSFPTQWCCGIVARRWSRRYLRL